MSAAAALGGSCGGDLAGAMALGGFRFDGMPVALPMAVLREVRPTGKVLPLPCSARAVVGGVDLRGCVVPLVDPAVVLGRDAPEGGRAHVVITCVDGLLFGIAVDEVSGIFACADDQAALPAEAVDGGLYRGAVRRADSGDMVALLSLSALAGLTGMPRVTEPAQAFQDRARLTRSARQPVLLLRCGRFRLAIDALWVQTTIDRPVLRPSVLARGHCRGVLPHAGRLVAAVDLAALCGLGPQPEADLKQAFVLRIGDGFVALLVSEVEDVCTPADEHRVPLSRVGLPSQHLFSQALDAQVRQARAGSADGRAKDAAALPPYLLLSGHALTEEPTLLGLAATNTARPEGEAGGQGPCTSGHDTARRVDAAANADTSARQFITFDVVEELAVPMEQVAEILRYPSAAAVFDTDPAMAGVMIDRGRSIPLFCLAGLAGRPRPALGANACVLVVALDDGWVGFVVPRLRAIESARWQPRLEARTALAADTVAAALGSHSAVLVRGVVGERMLRVVDLAALARQRADTPAGAEAVV